jgi:hypothetical protein
MGRRPYGAKRRRAAKQRFHQREPDEGGRTLMTVDELVAHEEIRQLAARYAVHLDGRHLDLLVGLFVSDVQVGRDYY